MAPTASATITQDPAVFAKASVPIHEKKVAENPNLKAGPQAYDAAPPTFDDKYEERAYMKQRLALAFRIFAKFGFDEGVAGHITIRDPVDPNTLWVNPFGNHFALMKSSDLIQVDHNGNVIAGGRNRKLNKAGFLIHAAIHQARPDVICAAHAHGTYGRAFCSLAKPLDIITQDHCAFYNDLALYEEYGGVVLDGEEGKNIAACLGKCKAALLSNHGVLTVGKSIEEAIFWFLSLERCCQVSLLANAAGMPRRIEDEEAEFNRTTMGHSHAGWFSALPEFELAEYNANGQQLL
ncbi:arad-like aldolase [Hyaloscypha variabilis]